MASERGPGMAWARWEALRGVRSARPLLTPSHPAPRRAIDPSIPPSIPQATLEALREPALAAQGAVVRSKVERIVVLMLENRSFDHLADDRQERLGVRVPTFVISAYTPPGLTNLLLDHASLHATIHRTFVPDAPFLSSRARVADTFGALLTRSTPSGKPPAMVVPGEDKARRGGTAERARLPTTTRTAASGRGWPPSARAGRAHPGRRRVKRVRRGAAPTPLISSGTARCRSPVLCRSAGSCSRNIGW